MSAVMSCLMTAESSAMSREGSSKVPALLASCARRSSFCDVEWMPRPTRADIRANSLVVPAEDEAPASIPAWAPRDGAAPSPPATDAPRDFAARSAAAANSLVLSRTVAGPIIIFASEVSTVKLRSVWLRSSERSLIVEGRPNTLSPLLLMHRGGRRGW